MRNLIAIALALLEPFTVPGLDNALLELLMALSAVLIIGAVVIVGSIIGLFARFGGGGAPKVRWRRSSWQ